MAEESLQAEMLLLVQEKREEVRRHELALSAALNKRMRLHYLEQPGSHLSDKAFCQHLLISR